ncbi:uncharacterized protein LOC143547526 [Bidens hawaiensis]|uniref:uncharacterized protein LOC143547526 n=1 Tax=Bidens hawaiensis TaxID=980011 RepID=UPI00404918C8
MVSSKQKANLEPEPWRDLSDKVVMVTGASSGIGWELCIDLAKSGCRIIAAARRMERLKALCDEINSLEIHGCHANRSDILAVAVELDVIVDSQTIEASVHKAWDAFGRIDALINNAGTTGPLQISLDLSEEDWETIYKTNVRGPWLVSKYVCLRMRAFNLQGSVINISSVAGLGRVHPHGKVAYCSSKSAIDTVTKVK